MRDFSDVQAIFVTGILAVFQGKMYRTAGIAPLLGHVDGFQLDHNKKGADDHGERDA